MLIYHPAYDVNHCVYRIISLLEKSAHEEFDIELARLLDFYILFPHLLKSIKPLPAGLAAYRQILKRIPDAYESIPNPKRILFDLEQFQNAAFQSLMAKGLVDIDSFRKGVLRRTDTSIPEELEASMLEDEMIDSDWFTVISDELPSVQFLGRKGLKSRSSLMEFRYDA